MRPESILPGFETDGFLSLHDERGKAVNIADPRRPGMAAVPLFDGCGSAVPLLLHLSASANRHGDVVLLARWDGADLPGVVAEIVGLDRSVATFFDGEGRWLFEPSAAALAPIVDGAQRLSLDGTCGTAVASFDLVAVEWSGLHVS